MSFSNQTKEEIIKKNLFKKENKALLQGLFLASGNLIVSNHNLSFSLANENEKVIDFIADEIRRLFPNVTIDIVSVRKNFKGKEKYEISVDDESNMKILQELGIVTLNADSEIDIEELFDKSYLKTKEASLAFFTGAFLGAGSVSVPQTEIGKKSYGYHFEIGVVSHNQAEMLSEILSNFDIFAKIIERGDQFIVYLKNSETICDCLALMGASKVVLELENDKVSRDISNATNRQINCMTANISKTVDAALKQIKAIETIQNTIGIENLPETLAETALLRLSNPEASLKDLIDLMEKPISRGAIAQRFDKIIKISQELGENDG